MGTRLSPKEILGRADLSRDEKIALLRDLDVELRELLVMDDENMTAARPPTVSLQEVEEALASLGARHARYAAPTTHG